MKKIILLLVVAVIALFSLTRCNSPSAPQPKIMVPITLKYNQNEMEPPDGYSHSDTVKISRSWEGRVYDEMKKDGTPGWFIYQAADIEAPNKYTPDTWYGWAEFTFIVREPRFDATDGVYTNDQKILVVRRELGICICVFWVNCQGTIRTTRPQGN